MIFRRAIINELSNTTGAVFTVLFSIVLTVGLVQIINRASGGALDPEAVFELAIYSGLTNLPALLGLALFIAVIMTLMRIWQDSEMPVWFSSGGISLLAFIWPVLKFTFPLIVFLGVMSCVVTPWANSQTDRVGTSFKQKDDVTRLTPGRFVESAKGKKVFFIENTSEESGRVKNIFLSEVNKGIETIIEAKSGKVSVTPAGERYITLYDGTRYEMSKNPDAAWRLVRFETYSQKLEVRAEAAYGQAADNRPFTAIWNSTKPEDKAQVFWRLSWPLMALNLVLLAIPLSYIDPRANKSLSLVMAVLIFILYLNGISIVNTWVSHGKLVWWHALAGMNLAVLGITVVLFVRRVWLQRWIPKPVSDAIYSIRWGAK